MKITAKPLSTSLLLAGFVVAMAPHAAFAQACTLDQTNNVAQTAGATCVPTRAVYDGTNVPATASNVGTVLASGANSTININQDTTATYRRGSGTGAAFHAINGGSAATPARINSPAGVTLKAIGSTTTNSHGVRASGFGIVHIQGNLEGEMYHNQGRILLAEANGTIIVDGSTKLTIDGSAGQNTRGIGLEGASSTPRIELNGPVEVISNNASGQGVQHRTGTLIFTDHLDIDINTGAIGINGTGGAAGTIDLTSFEIEGGTPSSQGISSSGTASFTLTATGVGDIRMTGPDSIGVRQDNPNSTVSLGPGSEIEMLGPNSSAVRLLGAATFEAGTGLTLKLSPDSRAFNYLGSTTPVSLTDAVVTAPILWHADATTNTSYTANGGSYTGSSVLLSGGTLGLTLNTGAVWAMTADSAFTTLSLQGNAILDASLVNPLGLQGDINNAGGVVSLARSDSSPANVLVQTGTFTANGGVVEVNTVLNDASTSVSDLLRVDTVIAGGVPTLIRVLPDAASVGALTTGNGILIVEVTGGAAASAAGAFGLEGGFIDHGGFRYTLERNAGDGNWYLVARSSTPQPATAVSVPATSSGLLLLIAGLLPALVAFGRRYRK